MTDQPPPTLAEELDRYLRHLAIERGRSPHTLAAYRRDLTRLLDALAREGVVDATGITREHVTAFARSLRDGPDALAASSVARMLSSVRGFTRFLVDEGRIPLDPAADLVAPKLPDRLPKALTIRQVETLLGATEGEEPADLRDRALLELLYATGARVSEAVALNVDDLVGDAGTTDLIRLFGKGGKQRVVPVGSYARAALDAYLVRSRPLLSVRGRATPALFLGMRGARLSRQNAWLLIRAAAERAASRRGAGTARHLAAQPSALVRDPSVAGRRRRAGRTGAARARECRDDADLHARDGGCPPRHVRDRAPAGSLTRR